MMSCYRPSFRCRPPGRSTSPKPSIFSCSTGCCWTGWPVEVFLDVDWAISRDVAIQPVERPAYALPSPLTSAVSARRPVVKPGERSLTSYLLLPRPGDLGKAVIVPVTFALGSAAVGGTTASRLSHGVLVWLVLEFLVYQARYQWNDIRGF